MRFNVPFHRGYGDIRTREVGVRARATRKVILIYNGNNQKLPQLAHIFCAVLPSWKTTSFQYVNIAKNNYLLLDLHQSSLQWLNYMRTTLQEVKEKNVQKCFVRKAGEKSNMGIEEDRWNGVENDSKAGRKQIEKLYKRQKKM